VNGVPDSGRIPKGLTNHHHWTRITFMTTVRRGCTRTHGHNFGVSPRRRPELHHSIESTKLRDLSHHVKNMNMRPLARMPGPSPAIATHESAESTCFALDVQLLVLVKRGGYKGHARGHARGHAAPADIFGAGQHWDRKIFSLCWEPNVAEHSLIDSVSILIISHIVVSNGLSFRKGLLDIIGWSSENDVFPSSPFASVIDS
jgi:hypothetical protein